jgi:hypothetical protein
MNDDISHTIIAKSDQLNASDLLGGPITVTVESVGVKQGRDQPVSIKIDGGYQPYKPCLTVRRILAKLWGVKSAQWVGRQLTLYCDESVKWAGEEAGGIRVSHMSNISGMQKVTTRASKHTATQSIIYPIVKLPDYSDSEIEKNKTVWIEKFRTGTNPKALIAAIKQKHSLTPAQENKIIALSKSSDIQ